MADPITGVDVEQQQTQDVLDYLGRRSPITFSGQVALPGVALASPSSGPSGPGGIGAESGPTTAEGGSPGSSGGTPEASDGGDPASSAANSLALTRLAISAAQSGKNLGDVAGLFGSGASQFAPSFPSGLSFGPEATGAEATLAQFPSDLRLTGRGDTSAIQADGFTLGGEEAGAAGSGLGAFGDVAGAGLSGASLLALIATMAESGQISPQQAIGLIQSAGGTAASLGQLTAEGGALAGMIAPEAAALLGGAGSVLGGIGGAAGTGYSLYRAIDAIQKAQEDPRHYATATGTGAGLAAGGIIGSFAGPYGTLVGLGAGGALGSTLGDVIARNLPTPHSLAVRHHWGEVATDAINNYGFGIQKAAGNGNLIEVQHALSQPFADGHVRAYLNLPESLATALGVPPVTDFASLAPDKFLQLIKAFNERDSQSWLLGTGDVPYLGQSQAQGVADTMTKTASATLTILGKSLQPILDQMAPVDPEGMAQEWAQKWTVDGPPPEILDFVMAKPAYAEVYQRAAQLGPQMATAAKQQADVETQALKDLYVNLYGSAQVAPQSPEAAALFAQIWGSQG